jgi:hypothetical protein
VYYFTLKQNPKRKKEKEKNLKPTKYRFHVVSSVVESTF